MTTTRYIEPGSETPAEIIDNIRCLGLSVEAVNMELAAVCNGNLPSLIMEQISEGAARLATNSAALAAEIYEAERTGVLGCIADALRNGKDLREAVE